MFGTLTRSSFHLSKNNKIFVFYSLKRKKKNMTFSLSTMVSGQIIPDWNYLQANHMSTSFRTNKFNLFILDP